MTPQYMVETRNPKFYNLITQKYFSTFNDAVDAYDAIKGKATLYKITEGKPKVFWTKH